MQRSWEFSNPFSGNFLFVSLDLSEPGTFPQVTQETFKFLNCCLLKGWTWEGASPLLTLVFVFFPKAFAAGFGVVSRWVFCSESAAAGPVLTGTFFSNEGLGWGLESSSEHGGERCSWTSA